MTNEHSQNVYSEIPIGDIAQLARAAALQAVGRGFESLYLHEAARRGLKWSARRFFYIPREGKQALYLE
ncbi:hypothetical protein TRIP_E330002 [uncultured Spirochaetota bacterium]|nr:hypothetical protein TRIP_E330002 [uncultured Spirochaetota bacterium]